jgi:hypothetical protein
MNRRMMLLSMVIGAVASAALPGAMVATHRQPSLAIDQLPIRGLSARLTNLDPATPERYLQLAEELAAETHLREARELARQLFARAFELDRLLVANRKSDGALARSAALGLASLEANPDRAAWLSACARLVAQQGASLDAGLSRQTVAPALLSPIVAADLGSALSLARNAEGRQAERYLSRPGVRQALEMWEDVLSQGTRNNLSGQVNSWMQQWPRCRTCGNRRIVPGTQTPGSKRATDEDRKPQAILCPQCQGNPGPAMSGEQLTDIVRGEALLLRGVYRSWAAQILVDGASSYRPPRPERLLMELGIDPQAMVYRGGKWIAP